MLRRRRADRSERDLTGRFPPTVRKPVGVLPSGRPVLGMADVVVLNDPITGQGSNNAAKCAASYLAGIQSRDYFEWFMEPESANGYLAELAAAA